MTMTIGDRVRYKSEFLRSISAFTGPLGQAVGTVRALKHLGGGLVAATVDWNRSDVPPVVNTRNLERQKGQHQ